MGHFLGNAHLTLIPLHEARSHLDSWYLLYQKTPKPVLDRTFSLEEIVAAHQYMESNQQNGKIVVIP